VKVLWTDTALGHLTAIHDYIAQDAPLYARILVDRLTSRSKQIAQFPGSGRVVPEYEDEQVRELLEGTYRVIYEVYPDHIDVVAVIHGARELPPVR
jgi:toxin ParE1/3/4